MSTILSQLDLNLLRVFRAILETGHLTKAAERLHLSQPATSHALARLRDQLGDKLFIKGPRGMTPTALAASYATGICDALDKLEDILKSGSRFSPETTSARLRIATTDYTETVLWPVLYQDLAEHAPGLVIESVRLKERVPYEDLEERRIDVAVGSFSKPPGSLKAKTLYREDFVVLFGKKNRKYKSFITLEEYGKADHLLVAPWGVPRGQVDEVLEAKGMSRRIAMTVGHFAAIPGILERTDFITTLPKALAMHWMKRYEVGYISPPLPLAPVKIDMLWHEQTDEYPPAVFLRQRIRQCAVI